MPVGPTRTLGAEAQMVAARSLSALRNSVHVEIANTQFLRMVALTMAMAYDHFHEHIRVNMVIPGGGGIVTGMSVGRADGNEEKFVSRAAAGTVAGRSATPADVAKSVAFLLSEDAQVISGTVLDVGCFAHQGGPVPARL